MFGRVCLVFFSPSSKIIFFFSFHPSLFIQLNTSFLFFSLLFVEFFVGMEDDLIILDLFVYCHFLGIFFTNSLNLYFFS
jgi:hypothetical protein